MYLLFPSEVERTTLTLFTMQLEVWLTMILMNLLTNLSCAEVHFNLETNIIPLKECNLIVASQIRIDKGMNNIANKHCTKPQREFLVKILGWAP